MSESPVRNSTLGNIGLVAGVTLVAVAAGVVAFRAVRDLGQKPSKPNPEPEIHFSGT